MTPRDLLQVCIRPTLAWLGEPYASPAAERFLVAVAVQESGLRHRRQQPQGPARSFFQLEPQTVRAVLEKWPLAAERWMDLGLWSVTYEMAVEFNDPAACIIARGIMWLDPHPIPTTEVEAWQWYAMDTWRPGKPRPEKWSASWAAACEATDASNR